MTFKGIGVFGLFLFSMSSVAAGGDTFIFGTTGFTPNFLDVSTSTGSLRLSTDINPIFGPHGGNNQGWWSTTSNNQNDNDNFYVGSFQGGYINNYFTFDITSLAGHTITGMTLNIQNPGHNSASLLYLLHDVSTSPLALATKYSNPNIQIYEDLGTGVFYGSQQIPLTNDQEYFISLNADAVSDLQLAVDTSTTYFSIGGTVAKPVPEPSAFALAGVGCLGLAIAAYRKRRQAA